ncbi:ATP-binding cassette domain-containing protein, partial [Burkholderia pseudomallei]|uniref:ATP-binding cassette domain-containing protein n=1 Tax=Burkholderia pseudomallei TaxID=28450 RepID=UPI0011773D42
MNRERRARPSPAAARRAPPPDDAPRALEVDGLAGDDYERVSFCVRRGEVVGLAGATSSGRTSVAEAVAGLRAPRAGAVRVVVAALAPAGASAPP